MKRIAMSVLLTLAGASLPVLAVAMGADADGNGVLSMEEVKVMYPEITESVFAEIDADADGAVSEAEYNAAVKSGLLPSTDG